MKSKVKLSTYCILISLAVIIAFIIGIVSSWGVNDKVWILVLIFIGLLSFSLFYWPMSIDATDSALLIRRMVKTKVIPYSDILSVDRCYPSAGGLRLCGSGGFLGYWGYFSDIIIGSYFGYYGKRDQCILIRLKDDKQYVISCENPDKMLAFIESKIN